MSPSSLRSGETIHLVFRDAQKPSRLQDVALSASPLLLIKSSACGRLLRFSGGTAGVLYRLMLRFSESDEHSSKAPYCTLVCVCVVFMWAAHGHMHTWRKRKTSQTKSIPSTGVSPQGITMTTKAKISRRENTASVFFFLSYFFTIRFLAL